MSDTLITAGTAFMGTLFGALTTYLAQRSQMRHEMNRIRESNKTEFQAEQTALHFLSHSKFTDRSFETLQRHLGGFEPDELRKILVRAGAIRSYRDDGSEWWRLLSRNGEYIENKRRKYPRNRVAVDVTEKA